jgi:hypothetical protein
MNDFEIAERGVPFETLSQMTLGQIVEMEKSLGFNVGESQ